MQVTFNIPKSMECEVKKLAAHMRVSTETLLYCVAFTGFLGSFNRLFAHELPFEKRTEQTVTIPLFLDRSEKKSPAPINWSKWSGAAQK